MSSPVATVWLADTRTSVTVASCGAAISFCIFIASRIRRVSPFLTCWPADTATDKILPGIGAFTVSAPAGTGAAALGASQLLPVDNELLQEIKISPEDNLSLDMIHLEEMGDFNKFFENMSPEQMKQMEEMANQMMQMFGGSGAEGSANLLNLFAEEEVQESTEDKKS